jgi:hypothetical protein
VRSARCDCSSLEVICTCPLLSCQEGLFPHLADFTREYVLGPGYDFGKESDFGLALVLDGLRQHQRGADVTMRHGVAAVAPTKGSGRLSGWPWRSTVSSAGDLHEDDRRPARHR